MPFPRTVSASLAALTVLAGGLAVAPPAHAASWTTVRTLDGSVLQACATHSWFAYTVKFRLDNRRGTRVNQVRASRSRDNVRMTLTASARKVSSTKSFRATSRDQVVITLSGTGRNARRATSTTVRVTSLARC